MSTDGASPQEGVRRVLAGLGVLCGLAAAALVLGVNVGKSSDDTSGVSLARGTPSMEFVPPVPLAAGQTYVLTEVQPSGDLMVTQWIRSSEPLESILLARPDVRDEVELKAAQVRVVADGQVVVGPDRVSLLAGRYNLSSASAVQVSYLLTGAVVRSSSAPGRVLARTTAMDVTYEPASTQVTRSVVAPEVLSLACSRPVSSAPSMPCGDRRSLGEWVVELDGSDARNQVMAQLTLR